MSAIPDIAPGQATQIQFRVNDESHGELNKTQGIPVSSRIRATAASSVELAVSHSQGRARFKRSRSIARCLRRARPDPMRKDCVFEIIRMSNN